MTKDFIIRLKMLMNARNMTQADLSKKTGIASSSISDYLSGKYSPKQDKMEVIAKALNVNASEMFFDENKEKDYHTIPVYNKIPSGILFENIKDITDYEDLSYKKFDTNKQYVGLKVVEDQMYPKYLEGDTIIIEITENFESGQDCVVYVNGNDATLKTVKKNDNNTITLTPQNPNYAPRTYGEKDDPIKILGVVKQIRRDI